MGIERSISAHHHVVQANDHSATRRLQSFGFRFQTSFRALPSSRSLKFYVALTAADVTGNSSAVVKLRVAKIVGQKDARGVLGEE